MSTNKIIAELDAEQMSREIPEFAPGDTVSRSGESEGG
jgi:large subunit ribosomal protein L19